MTTSVTPIVKTARAIVTEQKYPALFSQDDGLTLSKAATWLAGVGRQQNRPVIFDLEGLQYKCENTITVRNSGNFQFGYNSGFTILSTVSAPPNINARNRAHVLFRGGDKVSFGCGPNRITGPHADGLPYRSTNSEWEQQCGVWFQSCTEVDMTAKVDIDHVWGDFVDFGFAADDPRTGETAKVICGRWDRPGRIALTAGSINNLEWLCDGSDSSYIKHCNRDVYHVEIEGDRGGFEDHNIHDLMVYGSMRCHLTGMNYCNSVEVSHNLVTGHLYVQCAPSSGVRLSSYQQSNNVWQEEWDMCDVYYADSAVLTGNTGPVDASKPLVKTDGTAAVMQFGGCKSVVTSPNNLTRV